jgi:DnaJ family protein C protein 3
MDRGSHEYRDTAQRAEAALKQSKTKDYYKILGVPRSAGEAEFKRAYRRLALEWHPDKVAEELKEAASKKFQDIGEAYEVLSNAETKAKYDRGEDVFGLNQGGGGGGGHHHGGFPHPFHQQFHFRHG